jgi:hypothetical protein
MKGIPAAMFVWQGVAMDPLKFHTGPPCPTLLCPAGMPPLKQLYRRFRGSPQGRRPMAIFHPFRHPTPYPYASFCQFNNKEPTRPVRSRARLKNTVKEKIGWVWLWRRRNLTCYMFAMIFCGCSLCINKNVQHPSRRRC